MKKFVNFDKKSRRHFDIDTQWKELITDLNEDFIHYFFPDIAPQVDFSKPVEFLDKEFAKIVPEYIKGGTKRKDKLLKVHLKNGEIQILFIHVEVQSKADEKFTRRMFVYYYRLYDRYGENIEALAIYTDAGKTFCPDTYYSKKFKTRLEYEFRVYKTATKNESKLLADPNPFALAILATQYMHRSKKKTDSEKRLQFKKKLIRLLLKRGYPKKKIGTIMIFIANILALPPEMETLYRKELKETIKTYEDMPLTFENSVFAESYKYEGFKQGIEIGVKQAFIYKDLVLALNAIKQGFDDKTIILLTSLDEKTVEKVRSLYEKFGDDTENQLKIEYGLKHIKE